MEPAREPGSEVVQRAGRRSRGWERWSSRELGERGERGRERPIGRARESDRHRGTSSEGRWEAATVSEAVPQILEETIPALLQTGECFLLKSSRFKTR